MGQTATIAGFPIIGQPVEWIFTTGVEPNISVFTIRPDDSDVLQSLADRLTPVELLIGDTDETGNQRDHRIRNLYIIDVSPGTDPWHLEVTVVDRRFWWSYKWIYKAYNIRRRVGQLTRQGGDIGEALQAAPGDDLAFRAGSLNQGSKWTGKEILEDILTGTDGLGESSVVIDSTLRELTDFNPEDLFIDDRGDAALAYALSLMPGADVTVDRDGRIVVFSVVSGREREIVGSGSVPNDGAAGPEIVGGGHVRRVSNSAIRPRYVDVYFTRQVEIRMDFRDDVFSSGSGVIYEPPARYVENVLPNPDFSADVTDANGVARTVALGTYITISEAVGYWQSQIDPQLLYFGSAALNFKLIRRALVPGVDLLARLGFTGSILASTEKANWFARWSALEQHYRQTFRLPRGWVDVMLEIKAEMVATMDPLDGRKAPARVFADHAYQPSMKAMFVTAGALGPHAGLAFATNVNGYPGVGVEIGSANARPSPATLQVLDSDQGILRIAYNPDVYNRRMRIFPSKIDGESMPFLATSESPQGYGSNASYDAIPADTPTEMLKDKVPQLDESHKAAMLFSAVPFLPNSKKVLYRVRVYPHQVARLLPLAARAGMQQAFGPPQEVRIRPGVEVARFRWTEATATLTERCFGRGGDPPSRAESAAIVINDDPGSSQESGASIVQLARAAAAAVYADMYDRVEGSMTGRMNSSVRCEGALSSITLSLDSEGKAHSHYAIRPRVKALDMYSFLDDGTRQVIAKNIEA